ncbi:tRNA threonylcarbamoyladenosine dehydratase [Mesosutterella sp. OilRF-GAM-744-9]|uniref:tRNA threonylcarbamoyladenosine dehydratase n=1 Tax=Mesosutterella porci TaxID=2915351 RepID=A0ABS9MNV7_9BURK|nr:tRNA threonylcarbamoyladenosine dehydratase [Mesosutterella sp. oilRF-744-WT-GAM-9]MCG5030299.1 tRNA threonylcarbamoyladenosine dehydratase [Mesosutterella sp. oilRF-744-WT-GAM-9]MCI6531115.1 tRNA threonylcarbamoyladenosine dehydratase [Mesosutterella sp.]
MGTTTDKRRFGGIERVYGPAAAHYFQQAHVIVVGMGGVGSWATEALARAGVGRLTLVDGDVSEESNTNRQCHALDGAYGRPKAELMAERVRLINPDCRVQGLCTVLEADRIDEQLPLADVLIDAIDSLRAKAALIAWGHGRGLFTVTSGGGAGRVDPGKIQAADVADVRSDPLVAALRRELRSRYGFPRGSAKGRSERFHVTAVFSTEPLRKLPPEEAAKLPQGAGLGTVMTVTASFGLRLASLVLGELAARARAGAPRNQA